MTQNELKRTLYNLVAEYFAGASITWGKVKAVSPNVPQVVLSMGGISRRYLPITRSANGVPVNGYPSQTTLQVDLYTKGAATNNDPGVIAAYENTAVNDLIDFLNFLNSAYVDEWGDIHDVSILCNEVNDLTELVNDVTWDYRAMMELEIGFTQSAVGHTGMMYEDGMPFYDNGAPMFDAEGYALDRYGNRLTDEYGNLLPPLLIDPETGRPIFPPPKPTPSGGRTSELAGRNMGWFEQVENPNFEKEET